MRGAWIDNGGSSELVVVVMGWSCDENMLPHFRIEGRDIYAIYHYTELETEGLFTDIDLSRYSKISMVAWSFGVWAAGRIAPLLPRLDLSIAVNGTPVAISDKFGIPRRGFKVTVWAVNMLGLDKFNERMVGEYQDQFIPALRQFPDQIDELKALAGHFAELDIVPHKWDIAIVGGQDTIFPSENMLRYWESVSVPVVKTNMAHYPFTNEGNALIADLVREGYDR